MGLNPLVGKVRAAHPGDYDDLDDAQLTKMILAKHPEYEDLAAPPLKSFVPEMQQSNIGIAADNSPSGADPHNPGNMPEQIIQQAKPSDQSEIRAGLATTALATAGGSALTQPGVAAGLGQALTDAAGAHPVVAKIIEAGLKHLGQGAGIAGTLKLLKLFESK